MKVKKAPREWRGSCARVRSVQYEHSRGFASLPPLTPYPGAAEGVSLCTVLYHGRSGVCGVPRWLGHAMCPAQVCHSGYPGAKRVWEFFGPRPGLIWAAPSLAKGFDRDAPE